MNLRLDGKVALVTGASRGIGLAVAHALAESGADVMLSARKAPELEAATESLAGLDGSADWFAAHAGDPAQAAEAALATTERFGGLDLLVNNAATNPHFGPLLELDKARADKTVDVNQYGIVAWTQAAVAAGLGARHGSAIVNVASVGGLGPEPGIGWYNATKAAVIHLTGQLAWELAPRTRVNAVAPGLVKTQFARALWEPREDELTRNVPLGRLGVPEDVGAAVLFLLSDAASWITGHTLVVDGGTTTQPSGGVG